MIRVYFLPVEISAGVETVAGAWRIHNATLEPSDDPATKKLTMDTTQDEHASLVSVALSYRDATADEVVYFNTRNRPEPLDPDTLRAWEIAQNSPDVMTQVEIWEALRIIIKRVFGEPPD